VTTLICVPGWLDSDEAHWQTLWLKSYPMSDRAEQSDWMHPDRDAWVAGLDAVIERQEGSVVLVGHSLGSSTVVQWAAHASLLQQRRIKGALLVAPPDVHGDAFLSTVPATGFADEPDWRLPFPSILVASSDDPFCELARAEALARSWGCRFVSIGAAGHINGESHLGHWEVGQRLLQRLILG
jgi:uncharacterized protein